MNRKMKYVLTALLLIVVVGGVGFFFVEHSSPSTKKAAADSCVSRQFNLGSSGNCVDDIQTMVDFMETDGLTQCPFTGSATLSITGTYDTNTQNQVKVVQTWFNCYDREEGQPAVTPSNGIVATATWSGLCTYAFQYPSQAKQGLSPYLSASLAAGKDAGC